MNSAPSHHSGSKLLAAKPVLEAIHTSLRARVSAFALAHHRSPRLAVVLVGDHAASVIYTRKKGEAAHAVGMEHETLHLPETATPTEVRATIERLNQDPAVDGILIQRPLPHGFKEEEVLYWVDPKKDVDAFHPENAGRLLLGLHCFRPCTPSGVLALLDFYGIHVGGKLACVLGRSSIVGKPMAALLTQRDATVIHCHSKTPGIEKLCAQADIVVASIGKPEIVRASWIKEGAIVIDVGINRLSTGKVVGDVAFAEVERKASFITPVPGGVGPMTISILLQNTLQAAEQREKAKAHS